MINDHAIAYALLQLKERFPGLCLDGLCPDRVSPTITSMAEIVADGLHHADQVPACVEWLSNRKPRQTFNHDSDTYVIKHTIEAALEGRWVSHTSLLIAAQLLDLEMVSNPYRQWAGSLKLRA